MRTVSAMASARAMKETTMEDIFQASFTPRLSALSGQKRSKKKPDPKIVATAMPMKMLYEKTATMSLFCTVALPSVRVDMPSCWST